MKRKLTSFLHKCILQFPLPPLQRRKQVSQSSSLLTPHVCIEVRVNVLVIQRDLGPRHGDRGVGGHGGQNVVVIVDDVFLLAIGEAVVLMFEIDVPGSACQKKKKSLKRENIKGS